MFFQFSLDFLFAGLFCVFLFLIMPPILPDSLAVNAPQPLFSIFSKSPSSSAISYFNCSCSLSVRIGTFSPFFFVIFLFRISLSTIRFISCSTKSLPTFADIIPDSFYLIDRNISGNRLFMADSLNFNPTL